MEGLKLIPYIALVIAIAGIILGAASITLGTFGDTMSSQCYNSSYTYNSTLQNCAVDNSTLHPDTFNGGTNLSNELYTVVLAGDSEVDISEQLPTVAIIAVMVIIISVISGVFVYMRYFR